MNDSNSGKRTVAELIAKYGEAGTSANQRRHRRRGEDTTRDTAPQAIIERVRSDSGHFEPVPESTHHTVDADTADDDRQPVSNGAPSNGGLSNGTRFSAPAAPSDGEQSVGAQQHSVETSTVDGERHGRGRFGRAWFGRSSSAPPSSVPPQPPPSSVLSSSVPPRSPVGSLDEHTIRLPDHANPARASAQSRQLDAPGFDSPAFDAGLDAPGLSGDAIDRGSVVANDDAAVTQTISPETFERSSAAEPDSKTPQRNEKSAPDTKAAVVDHDSVAFPDDVELRQPHAATGWWQPALLIAAGVIAGALMWLAFDWLWGVIPTLALIAAVLVIIGLVMGVRLLRRGIDVPITVLAAIVGVIVTVSPAIMLLLRH
ncbi:MAG: hypothetical protein J2O49_08125 [Sciscionella sp.]|nr:hypothetical protein [Sciscionella sp.]